MLLFYLSFQVVPEPGEGLHSQHEAVPEKGDEQPGTNSLLGQLGRSGLEWLEDEVVFHVCH